MIRILRFQILMLFVSAICFGQTATINLSSEKQVIRGFGGINCPGWIADLTTEQANTAFGNGSGQMGLSVLRVRISHDKTQFYKELPTAKIAAANGAIIFATPWTAPASMKTNNSTISGHLKTASYADYAAHLKGFCDYMSQNNVPLEAVSIQNEPDINVTYESCDWYAKEFIDFLTNNASKIGSTKLIVAEAFQFNRKITDSILNDATAASKVAIIGGHIYGAGLSDYPLARSKGKEVWMTEHFTDNTDANTWPSALGVAKEISDCMMVNFNVYTWWYIRRSYGLLTEDGNVSKRGYCMSQFSKYIRPGYVRVDATATPTAGVSVTAYKDGDNVVIVAVNTNTGYKTINFAVANTKVSSFVKYTTAETKNLLFSGTLTVANSAFSSVLDPSSVTTFVGKVNTPPTVAITAPTSSIALTAPATVSLTANAADSDGSIASVVFYNGTSLLGTVTAAPFTYSWKNLAAGSYTITAVATDNGGMKTTSSPVTFTVSAAPVSYVYQYDNLGNTAWTYTANWTPAAIPTAIDTAIIRMGECKIAQDFANLVRVEPNGVFRALSYSTIKNIELQGGTLLVNTSNQTYGMNATITVKDSSTIKSGNNVVSLFTLAGTISGSGMLTKTGLGLVKLTASASNFSGKWFVIQDTLTIASATGLGTMGVEVSDTAVLDVDVANTSGSLLVKKDGKLNLDANMTVNTAAFAGVDIPAGTYSATDYPAVISGSGKLIVLTCPACPVVVTQSIALVKGWNLISINLRPTDSTIATLFKGLDVQEIKNMDAFWRKDQPSFFNLLQTITPGEGYLVNMNAAGTLTVMGTPIVETHVRASLQTNGWQLIGCPYPTATPIVGILGSTFLELKNFEGSYIPGNANNTILNLEPGKGYLIKK